MPALDFPGRDQLIAALDAAVALHDDQAVTTALRYASSDLINHQQLTLPAQLLQPQSDCYARRELYASAAQGYSVIAMTWGPGQGTPVHDHAGLWCVEVVCCGQLEIVPYDLLERDGDHHRFTAAATIEASTGDAGSLIPPHEYHTIRNISDNSVALSLHVYQRSMTHCNIFTDETGDGWLTRHERLLQTDPLTED
jgi:predicted metal-dependent enzyme (double-stranded beta helix superfamily)